MKSILQTLIEVTDQLSRHLEIDVLLKLIAKVAAELVETERASVRMLNPTGDKLLAIARSSTSFHLNPAVDFRYGEGLMGWIVKHQQAIRSGDAEADPRFVARPGMKDTMGSFLGVPIIVGRNSLGVIAAVHPEKEYFTELHEQALTLLAGICAPQLEIARLSRLATVDPLTGALNRRAMEHLMSAAGPSLKDAAPVARTVTAGAVAAEAGDTAAEVKEPAVVSAIMADIDHFKQVNDTYGHLMGDQVLKQIATILASVVRAGDAVIRYGGEEFLIMLSGVASERALAIAERARTAIEATTFHFHEVTFHVTISMGVAQLRPGESREDLIKRADEALYEAKHAGRNRSVVAT